MVWTKAGMVRSSCSCSCSCYWTPGCQGKKFLLVFSTWVIIVLVLVLLGELGVILLVAAALLLSGM